MHRYQPITMSIAQEPIQPQTTNMAVPVCASGISALSSFEMINTVLGSFKLKKK